jgi:ligand-binding sensor domain-containing protein/two-component sensor histidine kinase
MRFLAHLLLFCILTLCVPNARASTIKRTTQIFTTVDGLPDNSINDIQKDQEGYLWIATNKGLSRFDGKNFVTFSSANCKGFFEDNSVNEIIIDQNNIYLISNQKGIKILDRLKLTVQSFIQEPVQNVQIDKSQILVLFGSGKLTVFHHLKPKKSIYLGAYVPKNLVVFNSKLYVLTDNKGIIQLDANSLKKEAVIPAEFIYMYGRLFVSKKLGLIYITGDKVYVLKNKQFVKHPLLIETEGVTNYFEGQKGEYFYISKSKTVVNFTNGKWVNHEINGLKNAEIKKLFYIDANSYFLATNQGLVRVTKEKNYVTVIDDNAFVENDMIRIRRKIIPINSSTMYLLGHPQIAVWSNGKIKNISVEKNHSMYDSTILNGTIYCTTDSYGFVSFDIATKKTTPIPLENIPLREFFYVIEKGKNKELFLGGTNKIVVYYPELKKTITTPLSDLIVFTIVQDDSLIWLGTNKGLRCASYSKGRFKWKSIPFSYSKSIRTIELDKKNQKIWLGTEEDGLFIVNRTNFSFEQKKDKVLKTIATLTNDKKGRMWASTFTGIVAFDLDNNRSYELTQKNGLSNLEFNYKSAALLPDGKVIFGGLNSYDIIDFNTLKESVKEDNRIFITGIEKNKIENQETAVFKIYFNSNTIPFQTGEEDLTLYLSDLDISASYSNFFTYQIDNEKPLTAYNNSIRISNLHYGNHDLTIFLYDNFGNLITKKTVVINAVVSFYYKTSFYIFLIIVLVLLGGTTAFSVYRARKTEAVVKDRIAMDLHDEVGTVLTRMLMTTHSKKEVAQQHTELKQGITEALFSIRTSIHALSGTKTRLEDLIDDTLEFLKKEFSNSSISYQFNHSKNIPNQLLKPELFRDCKLILFEATANALKYSNASKVTVDFQLDSELVITISDDGILTDINSIYNKGNGIGNIIKRTERNSGKARFYCNSPQGLTIELTFNWT